MILWANTSSATWRACQRARFEVNGARFRRLMCCMLGALRGRERQRDHATGSAQEAMHAAAYLLCRAVDQVLCERS